MSDQWEEDLAAESEDIEIVTAGIKYQDVNEVRYDDKIERYQHAIDAFVARERSDRDAPDRARAQEGTIQSTVYEPLSSDAQEIRVLELKPGDFDDELTCKLHVCSVKFKYDAELDPAAANADFLYQLKWTKFTGHAISLITSELVWYTEPSYVLGDSTLNRPILCNGHQTMTTKNLDSALRHLRDKERPIMLWCDQLCINQLDIHEKSFQVVLMSTIYEHAWTTLVWLGEDDGGIKEVFNAVEDINTNMHFYVDEHALPEDEFERLSLPVPGSVCGIRYAAYLSGPGFDV